MGILDDLKQQADSLRAKEAEEASRKAEQEAHYHGVLKPVMLRVLSYLDEVIKHINYVQPEARIAFPLKPDRTTALELTQSTYKLVIDSSGSPRQLDVRVAAHLDSQPTFELRDYTSIQGYTEYLNRYNFKHHRRDQLNANHRVQGASFTLEGPLILAARIQVDADCQRIEILLKNFMGPGVKRFCYKPDDITEGLLDRLGRLLLHEVNTLAEPVKMPEELLHQLRSRLEEGNRQAEDKAEGEVKAKSLWVRSAARLKKDR